MLRLLGPGMSGAAAALTLAVVGPTLVDQETRAVVVIGGGVVGLALARHLALSGKQVVVLEKEDTLVAGVSSGNSGLGCTGYDAPEGSLERRLLARSIQLHPSIMRSFGLSYAHVRKCGSLLVAWDSTNWTPLTRLRRSSTQQAMLMCSG